MALTSRGKEESFVLIAPQNTGMYSSYILYVHIYF